MSHVTRMNALRHTYDWRLYRLQTNTIIHMCVDSETIICMCVDTIIYVNICSCKFCVDTSIGSPVYLHVWNDLWHDLSTSSYAYKWAIHFLIHMTYVWHDLRVTWPMCDMTYVWHDLRVTWPIDFLTYSFVWHDSFICVIWLIHMCDMTHSYAWHDSFVRVTWLIHTGGPIDF